jgi:signal transduction histidine kinase
MSDTALVRLCRVIVGVGATLAAAGAIAAIDSGQVGFWWRSFAALGATVAWAFGAFVWLAIRSQPRNAAVWAMAGSVGLAIFSAGLGLAAAFLGDDAGVMLADGWHLAQAPVGVSWVLAAAHACSIPGLYIPLIYGLLLFPDGRLETRGARAIATISAPLIVIAGVTFGWRFRPASTSAEDPILIGTILALVLLTAASTIDLALRFRASAGVIRLQYKWVAWGTSLAVLVFGGIAVLPDAVALNDLAIVAVMLAGLCWVVAYGVALIRYRIYDINLVISRTLVYLGLVVGLSLAYVVVVAGLGTMIGGSNLWLAVAATALIAVVFEPTRLRLQRLVNRLVYGRQATPHEVLADLTARLTLAETPRDLLVRLADGLRAGTGAQRTAVWTLEHGRLEPIAISEAASPGMDVPSLGDAATVDDLPGTVVSVSHEHEVLGYLTLEEPPGMGIQAVDRQLAEDLAGAAALVLHRVGLEAALQTAADQLAESRLRMARAEDIELGRLGAELEDSVGRLVQALRLRVDRAREVASREGAERVSALLETIANETGAATDQIQALAHGIHPQALARQGLAEATRTLVAASTMDVSVEVDVRHRHGHAVEGAVYYCLAEALTNAAKHARGPVSVRVSDAGGVLDFSVADAGPGFDPTDQVRGTGLHNITDRVDMLGGVVSITSAPRSSTTIRGIIPIRPASALANAPAS